MWRYIVKRLLLTVPVLFGVAFVVFVMVRIVPGDPAQIMAGQQATRELVEGIRRDLGLDRPLLVQFADFMAGLLRGDLGRSVRSRAPVTEELAHRIPNTLRLAAAGMLVATTVGVTAGVVSAVRPYSLVDTAVMVVALAGLSMPIYWSGLMLILVFAVWLNWLPAVGSDSLAHLVLPAAALGFTSAAIIARMTRSAMLEVLRADYIRTARAKGLAERVVINRHALCNALIPVITVVGLQTGTLLSGAVLTESVFAWSGIGRLMVDATLNRDYPVVQGAVLLVALSFVLVNLVVDLLYALVDPRIRYE
ncbi:MAG: ABC transporter permease [Armatimonadota bacterium]|nr:ABC transporter permease [Armatimonadota bacterium]MDR7448242.1 ABC transporter permease [Armatimonadota bacterium]MDR7458273.1 ABC transporter permease [Armatimonadota bacterium]MDR7478424.1 ABC transporter permease [Armatimonadota bacterium]MDR7487358.1 ABC transporter permease [Armatimonadota bacterium]